MHEPPDTRGSRRTARIRDGGLAAVGIALLAFGCGGDTSGPNTPTVATVEIAGPTNAISVDETVQLTATAKDSDGNVLNGRTFTWSSNNEGVATVTNGLVRGVANGPVTISATTGNRSGSYAIQVTAPEPLVVSAVSPNPLVPGQTATITGTGFSTTPQDNTVTIAGASVTVNAAAITSLTVTVPASLCTSGDAAVVVRVGNRTSNAFPAPAQVNGTPVNVAAGQQVVLTDPAAFCLQFGASGASESYLIGVQSYSESGALVTNVRVAGSTAGAAPAGSAPLPALTTETRHAAMPQFDRDLVDRWRRHHAAEAEQQRRDAAMFDPQVDRIAEYYRRTASSKLDLAATAIPSSLNIGDPVSVRVLNGTLCSQFVTVATTVRAIGTNVVVLSDDTNPANGYSNADFADIASYFDSQVYPTDVDYFGTPTDIDGNNRIAIVVTRRVNGRADDTYGFVSGADFDPQCQAGNQAEIIYLVAPDPTGTYGFEYSADDAIADVRWLLAHEFTHVIQNGRRMVAGHPHLASWQTEGQAVYAEQLVGFAATGRQPGQNYGFEVIFNCSDPPDCATQPDPYDWFILTFVDLILYYGFDANCETQIECNTRLLGAPEMCTWVEGDTAQPCLSREVYGVPALFFTWLTDQFGPGFAGGRQGLHRQMINQAGTGFDAIETLVGQPMNELVAQWAAMLYTDGRVPSAHPRLSLSSWDLFDLDNHLIPAASLVPRERAFGSFSDLVQVRGGSTAYFRVSGAGRSATAIRVRRSDEGVLPAGMQVFIVRLQ